MALILAIEPDRRQAAQLTSLIRARVNADLVLAETAEQALHAIGDRVPDLVLVPALLAPQDDATLAGALRVIAAAARIQMLTIPVLAATSRKKQPQGVLAKWRRLRAEPAASGGCDPAMFGDQIAAYLAEAAAERAVNESARVAAAPAEAPVHKVAVPSIGTAPVGEAIGIPAIEGIPVSEIGMAPIEISTATIEEEEEEEVAVAWDTQTGVFAGVSDVPGVVGAAEPVPEPEREASLLLEELGIVEAPIEALGSVTVEATGESLPMAVDAISLPPNEDAWDTEEQEAQEEFFLGAYHGGELIVDESAVYELQTDDLSLDLVSFDQATPPCAQELAPPAPLELAPPAPLELAPPAALKLAPPPPLELAQPGPHELVSFGARPVWPNLEGMVAEELSVETVPLVDVDLPGLAVAPVLAELPIAAAKAAVAPTAPAAKPEWLELIDSLRRDVERLRGQRTQPPPVAAARTKESSSRTAAPVAGPVSPPRTPSVVDSGAKTKKRSGSAKPAQDEWGFFDPEQCGFAALLAKLDEITHLNDGI
jgi:hypothetical protein